METIAYDMLRWSIGFVIVSTVYLTFVWWLGRRLRATRKRKREAASKAEKPTEAEKPAEAGGSPGADDADGQPATPSGQAGR